MKYISTRGLAPELDFEDVVLEGLAGDGGLYIPKFLPKFTSQEILKMAKLSYQELFFEVTKYFIGDSIDSKTYQLIIEQSYKNFYHKAIAPLKQINYNHFLLELFHGPTLSFKDFALQFLGNLLTHILSKRKQGIIIIGATSGDTGSAAIMGCKSCQNAQIFILHPDNLISAIQRKQMTTILDKNVFNIALKGNFDDCQKMVKSMFGNQEFLAGKKMVAINSINWARIMAQIVYYFYSALRLGGQTNKISFIVPTGNFGDIYAGFLAKKMGLDISKLVIATNSNDILHRFLKNNHYKKMPLQATLSPSMDIQVSSNFERLLFYYYQQKNSKESLVTLMKDFEMSGEIKVDAGILEEIRAEFDSFRIDDREIIETISKINLVTGEVIDPHTAIGVLAAEKFGMSKDYQGELMVSLATASSVKFPEAVVKAGVIPTNLPQFLKDLPIQEERYQVIENDLQKIKDYIAQNIG
jgi:threonine synthase